MFNRKAPYRRSSVCQSKRLGGYVWTGNRIVVSLLMRFNATINGLTPCQRF